MVPYGKYARHKKVHNPIPANMLLYINIQDDNSIYDQNTRGKTTNYKFIFICAHTIKIHNLMSVTPFIFGRFQ